MTAIQSLSSGIVLTTQINAIKRDTPQVEACVFEVDVVYDEDRDGDEDKFCVLRKVSEKIYECIFFTSKSFSFYYTIKWSLLFLHNSNDVKTHPVLWFKDMTYGNAHGNMIFLED